MLLGSVLASRRVRWGASVAAALLVLAGMGSAAVSYVAADRLVHPPREHSPWTPATRGLAYEEIAFVAEDGVALAGWWIPADDALGTVIFLHGYGASKAQALAVAPFLHRAGMNVLTFDFRAHGDSGGTHTTVGLEEARDVRAAFAWAGTRADPERIALFGWSMGAAAALHAADTLPQARALVVDSGFAALSGVLGNNLARWTGLPSFPFTDMTLAFAASMTGHAAAENDPAARAPGLHRPLLVIQGLRDDIALEADGEALARGAGAHGTLWLVPEAGHVDARRVAPGEYEARVVEFLRAAFEAPRTEA